MHPHSLWADWDPTQPGSLKPRPNDDRVILPEDLVLILESTPGCVPDAILREYLLRALRGELSRPPGRPRSALSRMQCQAAEIWIKQTAEWVREEIKTGELKRTRGDRGAAEIAANRVGRMFGITGLNLRNQISAMKKREINLRA